MSSLWWLWTAQWRRGKSRASQKGKAERGQAGIAQSRGRVHTWQRGRWAERVWEKREEGLKTGWGRREGRRPRGFRARNVWWVDAGGEHHPVGHCGPITKTLSARQWAYQPPFHTSLINWEEWEEEEGKEKGMSLYQPSKCQKKRGPGTRNQPHGLRVGTVLNPDVNQHPTAAVC